MLRDTPTFLAMLIASVTVFAGTGCGGPMRYAPRSTRALEAESTISADIHRDQSLTNLQITIEHLAPPGRLQPGSSKYIVWQRRDANTPWSRVGELLYNPDSRHGTLVATAPESRFELQITAETNGMAVSPSTATIIDQQIAPAN